MENFVHFRSILITAALALPAFAQTPAPPAGGPKVAIIAFQSAVVNTKEGQQALAAMKTKFDPRKSQLEKRQADLQAMQDRLQKGGSTLAADARAKLQNDLSSGTRSLNNDAEDLNNDVQEEQGKLMQGMASKMGDIIRKYATEKGYTIVLDVSNEQTPVLWATPSINITDDIVKLYDQANAGGGAAAPAAPAATTPKPPAAPATSAPKPPATKKQ
jgi:outer membrane protein